VRFPAALADTSVAEPGGIPGISHGPRARSSPASSADCAVSAMAKRDNPEASGHLAGHFVEAAEAGGLTSAIAAISAITNVRP
jgi:hypothetical protein